MACDCLFTTNELLAEHNTKLLDTLVLPRDGSAGYATVTLVTGKIHARGKRAVVMAPTYCPFCGLRYAPEAEAEAAPAQSEGPTVGQRVRQILIHVLGQDPARVSDDAYLTEDLGADELDLVEIYEELEQRFGVQVAASDLERCIRVSDLVRLVARKLAEAAPQGGA